MSGILPIDYRPPQWLPQINVDEPSRITLLCTSQKGYQNLCRLITSFKLREKTKGEGAATLDELEEYAEGLICLTGGDEGALAAALASGGEREASQLIDRLTNIYKQENLYIELQRHGLCEEEWRNQAAIRLASSFNLPLLATNGVRYATPYDREILDIFTSIRNHTQLDTAGRLLTLNDNQHIRTAKEMVALFRDHPSAVANTDFCCSTTSV